MAWKITKTFDCCYGHRVWNQELQVGFSEDQKLVCRHLHGHQAQIHVTLQSFELERGMVTDFKNLGWMKKFIDDTMDHKFILDINDPILSHEVPILFDHNNLDIDKLQYDYINEFYIIKPEVYQNLPKYLIEKYEGIVFVNFVPTSENLSSWLWSIVDKKMSQLGVRTKSIIFYETPKSRSEYVDE